MATTAVDLIKTAKTVAEFRVAVDLMVAEDLLWSRTASVMLIIMAKKRGLEMEVRAYAKEKGCMHA